MPSEIQIEGISLAKSIETIIPFIQPLTPKHNKNVWGNCAVIISERSDEEINPHLPEMLEWLQDMNWPGAFCISKDFVIDMTELGKLERILTPCQYHMYLFSSDY